MKGQRRSLLAILTLSLGFLLAAGEARVALHALIGTSHADEDDEETETRVQAPSRVRVENGHIELVLSPAAVRNGGIVTARPGPATGRPDVQAYGEVIDAATLSDLASRYRNAAAQLTAAQARVSASRAALTRARALYRDRQNFSAAQLEAAESTAQTDEAELGAARSSLRALGAMLSQSWGPVLASEMTRDGALLESLLARHEYLIAVTLPPGLAPARAPQTADSRLPSGASLALTLVSPAASANPLVQGLRYFYRTPAAAGLAAGLNLPVVLASSTDAQAAFIVPESAVVWLQGKPWVYRLARPPGATSPGRSGPRVFVREPIDPGRQRSDGGYVVPGLAPDAQIVVRGAQLLLSEEFRAQVESQASD